MNLRRECWLAVIAVTCVLCLAPAFGQEPFTAEGIPPESDFIYRKHYDQVQEILATPDIAAREQKLEAFRGKLHADAKIRQYMEGFFMQIVQAYQEAGQGAKADALTAKMTRMFPQSEALAGQQFKAAYEKKDHAKVIELGEQMLAKSPKDPQVLAILAQSYEATNNQAKVMQIAPRLVEALGVQKAINYVVMLADTYRKNNDVASALRYYDMALGAYPSQPPQGWQPAQWNAVKAAAYDLKGKQALQAKDFATAVRIFSDLSKMDPKNDAAYLYIGLAQWQMQKLDEAQAAFAKAVVLDKGAAEKARQYLEQLYKPRNNNTLDGLDDVLAKARADLNL